MNLPEFSMTEFGERLYEVRRKHGYAVAATKKEDLKVRAKKGKGLNAFYKKLGLNPSVWGKAENGAKATFTLQLFVEYCVKLDVSPTWALFGIEPQALSECKKQEHDLNSPRSTKSPGVNLFELANDKRGANKDSKGVKSHAGKRTRRA